MIFFYLIFNMILSYISVISNRSNHSGLNRRSESRNRNVYRSIRIIKKTFKKSKESERMKKKHHTITTFSDVFFLILK